LEDEFAAEEDIALEAKAKKAPNTAPAVSEDAASSGSTDEEKQDASTDAAN
jgi:hypothetical protein